MLRRYFGKISPLPIEVLVGHNGELVIDELDESVYIMDGVTPGGYRIFGGASITAITQPSNPSTGTMWYDPETGRIYVYYNNTWVDASPSLSSGGSSSVFTGNIAPANNTTGTFWYDTNSGRIYVYYDGTWIDASPAVKGDTGPTGATGPAIMGPTGPQGATGPAASNSTYSNSNVAAYLTTYTGNITADNVSATRYNFANGVNILSNVVSKTTGSWSVTTGTNTYSFTVPESSTYQLWVDCNIPNGILVWNATATVTNSNVPVVGAQYAWVYNGGGSPVDFTGIPNQFIGTANNIVRSSVSPSATTNRFDFGINNTSGSNVTVRYGYIKIS